MRRAILHRRYTAQVFVVPLIFSLFHYNWELTRIKISSVSIKNISEGSEDSLNSGTMNQSQNSIKFKVMRNHFKAWKFHFTIQTEWYAFLLMKRKFCLPSTSKLVCVIIGLGLSPPLLHSANNRPWAVSSVTTFRNFSLPVVSVPPPDITPTSLTSSLVPIVGFV